MKKFDTQLVSDLARDFGFVLLEPVYSGDPDEPFILADAETEEAVALSLNELLQMKEMKSRQE